MKHITHNIGINLNNQGTRENHINAIKWKVTITTQLIISIASYKTFNDIEMQTIWKLF